MHIITKLNFECYDVGFALKIAPVIIEESNGPKK